MDKRTFIIESVANAPIEVDKSIIGFSPSDTMPTIQIHCAGLDGGDYTVEFLPHKGLGYVIFESGVAQTSAVLLKNRFLADAVKISFNNLGASASPKACITFARRSF